MISMVTQRCDSKGVTLVEVLVIFSIVMILATVVAVPFSRFRNKQAIQNATNGLVSLLNEARTKTLAAVDNTQYSVYVESSQAVLFQGAVYDANAGGNVPVVFDSPVTATTIALQGGGAQITFDRLKGTTSQHGTITLSIAGGESRTVTITSSGSIARN